MGSELRFCVYEHWRPDTNECFYVGKGTIKRANQVSRKENEHHSRIVAKLKRSGLVVSVRIVARGLSEDEAFKKEIELIAEHRKAGDRIVNHTDGGDGAAGNVPSLETRAKLSAAMKGRPRFDLRGRKMTREARAKISLSLRGHAVSATTRKKISDAQKGKPRPELIGRRISDAAIERLRHRVFTAEHRAKISAAKRGKPKSEAHKRALSDALKKWNKERKNGCANESNAHEIQISGSRVERLRA